MERYIRSMGNSTADGARASSDDIGPQSSVGWNVAGFFELGATYVGRGLGALTIVGGAVGVGATVDNGAMTVVSTEGSGTALGASVATDVAAVGLWVATGCSAGVVVGEETGDVTGARVLDADRTREKPAPTTPTAMSPPTAIHSRALRRDTERFGMTIVSIICRLGPGSGATMTGASGRASGWRRAGG
jgi:hypothetical protein